MNKNEIRPPRLQKQSRAGAGWLLVIIAIVVGASAVIHALTRNKTHAIGRQQALVEAEIGTLDDESRTIEMKIEEALSRKNLSERLAARRTKLRDISPESIVRISDAEPPATAAR